MKELHGNPFEVTKAVDYSDAEIYKYWVDISGEGGFGSFMKPTSPMPMFILGGKGSGKTHLMRYYSYAVQKIKNNGDILKTLAQDRYLGVYILCGGINASRFAKKNVTNVDWNDVFAYYLDLWLSRILVDTVTDVFNISNCTVQEEENVCKSISEIFLKKPDFIENFPKTLIEFSNMLRKLKKYLDLEINNCSFNKTLNIEILLNKSDLVFGIPKILSGYISIFRDIRFLYLVDEYENFNDNQRRYFNSLIREKILPSSFKVGSKLYGFKSQDTLSGDEVNKEGSEFEILRIDEELGRQSERYLDFASKLCEQRIRSYGYANEAVVDKDRNLIISSYFEDGSLSELSGKEIERINSKYDNFYPHLVKLRRNLIEAVKYNAAPGITSESAIDEIIDNIRVPGLPVEDKINTFLFYKAWSGLDDNLLNSSSSIKADYINHISGGGSARHKDAIDHFKTDLVAQIRRECKIKLYYAGFDTIIKLSNGFPRNLLVILKQIYKWATFYNEKPFSYKKISIDSQHSGIMDASEWFYRDARMTGRDGKVIRDCIERLCTLLKSVRFSDKPSECSISTFSADLSRVTDEAYRIINLCVDWSLLIEIKGGQKDRNSRRVDAKYQINPMLSPRWDLPLARRGALSLLPDEVNSIFDSEYSSKFELFMNQRIDRMTAPFWGKFKSKRSDTPSLFNDI